MPQIAKLLDVRTESESGVFRRDAFAGCGVNDTCEHDILRMPLGAVERARAAADARGTTGTVLPLFNEDPLTGSRALNTHPLHFYTLEGAPRSSC